MKIHEKSQKIDQKCQKLMDFSQKQLGALNFDDFYGFLAHFGLPGGALGVPGGGQKV